MTRGPLFERLHGPGPDRPDAETLAAHLHGREVLALNMVLSVDGRATVAGSSRPLSGEADHALFLALRRAADVLLVGRRTADAERYRETTRRPLRVVSREDVDLAEVVAELRGAGHRSILCEGGPTLNALLLRAGLVDELLVTTAPKLVGGGEPLTLLGGPLDAPLGLRLSALHEAGGSLFARYAVADA